MLGICLKHAIPYPVCKPHGDTVQFDGAVTLTVKTENIVNAAMQVRMPIVVRESIRKYPDSMQILLLAYVYIHIAKRAHIRIGIQESQPIAFHQYSQNTMILQQSNHFCSQLIEPRLPLQSEKDIGAK